MRRFLSLSLSSLLIFCLCPWQVSADEIVAQSHVDRPLYKEGEVLVKWKKAARSQTKLAVNSKLGLDSITEYESLNTSRVAVAEGKSVEETLTELSSDPLVYSAEPNYYVYTDATPNDPAYANQWGLHNSGQIILGQAGTSDMDIDAPEAWDHELGASSVVVGVIDTGIQITHQDLDANIWVNTGEIANNGIDDDGNGYVDDLNGWDFKNNDKTVFDVGSEDYHGTHVAGIIAAERNNSVGGSGVAQVKIMPLKALDQSDGGTISDVVEAINYAAAKGVDIINMSFGSSSYSQTLKDAIDNHTDILFVTSAGNDGVDIDTSPQYPAAYTSSNLITVAAINNQGALATFTSGASNYGDTHVDIGAPGRYIYSTLPT
ncbi:MAG: S8 family peptidase, partial [Candidatus Gracilibacteria bacterium]|nr:S8 family peptidase [Candidatus Gracilibacteria bacterium]